MNVFRLKYLLMFYKKYNKELFSGNFLNAKKILYRKNIVIP